MSYILCVVVVAATSMSMVVGWLVGVARKVLLSRGTADRVVSRAIFAPRCPEQGNRKAPETSQDSHYFEARGV